MTQRSPQLPFGFTLLTLLIFVGIALSGCATSPKVIERPVPVPCRVELPADRTFPFDLLVGGEDIHTQVKTLLADRRERIADRRETRAAAKVCQ